MKRGEVWTANLNPNKGAEVGKVRPVVILQDDRVTQTGLKTVLVCPLTTKFRSQLAPIRIVVAPRERLRQASYVMIEHIRALDCGRIGDGPLTRLTDEEMAAVEKSLRGVIGLL